MKKIIEEYNEVFFSIKGINTEAKIGIRLKDGEITPMSVKKVFDTYFIGSEEGELKMLIKLEEMGADVRDIIHILEIYNADYKHKDKYRFNDDQWENDKNSILSKREREEHNVNSIFSAQEITYSVYRDLRQIFFLKKFYERKTEEEGAGKIFMKRRYEKLRWIEGMKYNGGNTKTISIERFNDLCEWLQKYKLSNECVQINSMKLYRTMGRKEFEEICKWFKQHQESGGNIIGNLTFRDPVSKKEINDEMYTNQEVLPIPVKNHLGGYSQAKHYATADNEYKFLLQFTINLSHRQLLEYQKLALQESSPHSTIGMIAKWRISKSREIVNGSREEGGKSGYIGLKNEAHGNEGLSISLGASKDTRKLFQGLIIRIDLIEVIPPK